MSKMKDMAMTIEELHSAAAAINDVADWLTQQFSGNADEPKTEPKKEPELKLEDVRAVLADMSRKGHTAEIRALLQKYGAAKLSGVDPANYKALGMEADDPTEHLSWFNQEMDDHATGYATYVLEQVEAAKETCSDPVVLIEQRVDFSRWVEEGFGTADCIVIADGTLQIIDFKYGLGVLVSAEENPQMMCYALGAVELFDDIYYIDAVRMTIYQPRRDNLSTYDLSKEDLYRWADEVLKPAADLAFAGDGNFLCGEWCGFCKAKNECRARAETNLELARYDFKLPPLLTDEDVEEILGKVDALVAWASDIKDYALQQAISGKVWSGWKLVEGRSNRKYVNDAAVAAAVTKAGFDPYEQKLLGVTAMQKLLGKARFEEVLAGLIEKPQGKPTLVPESDKRPAMNNAKSDFSEN